MILLVVLLQPLLLYGNCKAAMKKTDGLSVPWKTYQEKRGAANEGKRALATCWRTHVLQTRS